MVDLTIKGNTGVPELTQEQAMEVFELIKTYGNADLAFKNQGNSVFYNKHFVIVDKEIDRLFNEMACKLSGCFVLEEAIPAEYDEMGEVVKEAIPAVMFQVTTESKFKESLSSDLLDTDEVYALFKGDLTWTQLKAKYQTE